MSIVLTDEDIEAVTHRFTAASQARVLTALGIPFKPHPTDRRLIVSRAAAEAVLGGPVGTAPANQEYDVDLVAVRNHGKKTPAH